MLRMADPVRGHPSQRRWLCLTLGALASVAVCSCATGPIELELDYPGAATLLDLPAEAQPRGCVVKIAGVVDERPDQQSFGYFGRGLVHADDVKAWVSRALGDLDSFGFRTGPDATAVPALELEVRLKQAYVRNVRSSMEAVVRSSVRFMRAGVQDEERYYRGSYVKVNWANGSGEVMETLNHAMANMMQAIARDLPQFCVVHSGYVSPG